MVFFYSVVRKLLLLLVKFCTRFFHGEVLLPVFFFKTNVNSTSSMSRLDVEARRRVVGGGMN